MPAIIYLKQAQKKNIVSTGGSSGGRRTSGSRSSSASSKKTTKKQTEKTASEVDYKGMRDTLYYGKQSRGLEWAQNKLIEYIDSGEIDETQARDLARYVGLSFN